MEYKKFDVGFEDNKLNLSLDTNQDGEKLMTLKINLPEAVQEAFKKGEEIEGQKVVNFKMSSKGLELSMDSDKDGEPSIELQVNLMEAVDEAGLLK